VHIVLADQSLVNYTGHSFEYTKSLTEQFQKLGCTVSVLANISVSEDIKKELNVVPCFRYGLDHNFSSILKLFQKISTVQDEWNYLCHCRSMYKDLVNIQQQLSLNTKTLILFHTIRHNHILPIVKWLESLNPNQRPLIALVMHFTAFPNYGEPSPTAKFYSRALKKIEQSSVSSNFHIFTDSDILANEYSSYTQLAVNVVPIPHTVQLSVDNISENQKLFPIRLTYLGDARKNKGFHFLPYVLNRLKNIINEKNIEVVLQANIRIESEWEIKMSVDRLRNLNVKLIQSELDSHNYYSLLSQAGIVLLPYTLDYYHSQTSGIFSESLAYGKIVIVPRGTWMAMQLKHYGAGVTFLPSDHKSLYEAITYAIDNYEILRQKALDSSKDWSSYHSSENFCKIILNSFN